MKYILGAPGTGKTKEILRLSEENRIPILCESQARKERLLQRAMQYGFVIPVPIVFSEVTPKDNNGNNIIVTNDNSDGISNVSDNGQDHPKTTETDKETTVKTGDDTSIAILLLTLIASGTGLATILSRKRNS